MGLHVPFEDLKHKLWRKQGLGVKMPIWLLTTKNRESPWFTCMHVACHILWESFQQKLQLCFIPHLNWRFEQKVLGSQSCENLNFENFKTLNFRVLGQKDICVKASWLGIDIRGILVASSSSSCDESFEFVYACSSFMHQKCSNH
jgi:hypothetical protein